MINNILYRNIHNITLAEAVTLGNKGLYFVVQDGKIKKLVNK